MKKIRILKAFHTNHYGFFNINDVVKVTEHFADYCVLRMNGAAQYVTQTPPAVAAKPAAKPKTKPAKSGKK